MAIALARDIVDGERIISGAHTEISFAAAMLAQKMHAPNIKLQLGGTCFLVNVADLNVRLPKTSTDYRMLRWAEIAYDHMETFMYFGAPGGRAYYGGKRPPTNKYFVGDKFFAGGIQVDGEGNANMIGLKGDQGRSSSFVAPARSASPISSPSPPVHIRDAPRSAHSGAQGRLRFDARPERLAGEQISWSRAEVDHHAAGDFHVRQHGRAQLSATFAGTSAEWVRENTGFSFELDPELAEVREPTDEELEVFASKSIPMAYCAPAWSPETWENHEARSDQPRQSAEAEGGLDGSRKPLPSSRTATS